LKKASLPAILDATLRSLEIKIAIVKVLQMANNLQIKAFARDRRAPSAPDFRPAWLLFISRSPTNMVKDLEKKSDPTIDRAVVIDPEKRNEVIKVTLPAMTLHRKALTADRTAVSLKFPPGGLEAKLPPFKYSCFLVCNLFKLSSYLFNFSIALCLFLVILASSFSNCLMILSVIPLVSPSAVVLASKRSVLRAVVITGWTDEEEKA